MSSDESSMLLPLSTSQREALEEATATYEAAVTSEVARALVARGIGKDDASTFRLGVVSDPFPGHEHLAGFLSIPYLDKDSKPLSLRFRCMRPGCAHEHHGKYMSLPDDTARVFNVRAIHQAAALHDSSISITEGELDAVILCKVGLHAVAIPGAQAWRSHHRRMLAGFNRVYVWGDPDGPGAEFNRKVTNSIPRARAIRLRAGDVTDTYKAGGAQALLDLLPEGDHE